MPELEVVPLGVENWVFGEVAEKVNGCPGTALP
jgi:hypothetical protein